MKKLLCIVPTVALAVLFIILRHQHGEELAELKIRHLALEERLHAASDKADESDSAIRSLIDKYEFKDTSVTGKWSAEPKDGEKVSLIFDDNESVIWGYDDNTESCTMSGRYRIVKGSPYNKISIYDISMDKLGKGIGLNGIFVRASKDYMIFYGVPSSIDKPAPFPLGFGADTMILTKQSERSAQQGDAPEPASPAR